MSPDLRMVLGPLTLATPIVLASGTWGYGPEVAPYLGWHRIGALVPKGLTREPWPGNPFPRIVETTGAILNSVGLQNVGLDAFLAEKLPQIRDYPTVRLANISGRTLEDYPAMAARLSGVAGIDGIEVNVSCPNVKAGGAAFGLDAQAVGGIVREVRAAAPHAPLFIKLSPNVTRIVPIAEAAMAAGATGLTIANTFLGMAIDIEARRPLLANSVGGLCGPATKPMALRLVWEVARAMPGVPIIGVGGVRTAEDAIEFLMAGASAVGIATAALTDPRIAMEVVDGVEAWCAARGVESAAELVRAAH